MAESSTADSEAFKAFEYAAWSDETVARQYAAAFTHLTAQAADELLAAARVTSGQGVLDVATGPGYVAAAAATLGASAIGLDFSRAMLEAARRDYQDIRIVQGDAEALPFAPASFDAVVMNFGLLHLGRPETALAEAQRVLRPGGRLAFTVWAARDQAAACNVVLSAIEAHGDPSIALPAGPPFFRFSDPRQCHEALLEAGFNVPDVRTVPLVWRLPSAASLFTAFEEGSARTRGLIGGQTREALRQIRDAVRKSLTPYATGSGLEVPMPAVLAAARKH